MLQNFLEGVERRSKQIEMFLKKYTILAGVLLISLYLISFMYQVSVALLLIIFKPVIDALGTDFVKSVGLIALLAFYIFVLFCDVVFLLVVPFLKINLNERAKRIKFIFFLPVSILILFLIFKYLISPSPLAFVISAFILSYKFYDTFSSLALYFSKLKKYLWGVFTGCLIIFFLLLGFYVISLEFQYLSLKLSDMTNTNLILNVGEISCKSSKGTALTNEKLYCKMSPKLDYLSATAIFIFTDGTIEQLNANNLSFVAPANVKQFGFDNITGIDNQGKTRSLTSEFKDYPFLDETESQTRKRASAYILALLGVVFFSIPSMMVNLKKLCEPNNNGKNDEALNQNKQNIDVKPQEINATSHGALGPEHNK